MSSVKVYRDNTYSDVVDQLQDLAQRFPDLIELTDAQTEYGLASPGSCQGEPCKHWIVRLGNRSLHNEDTPEVFFSGALHGDERVGPNAVTAFMEFAAENYETNAFVRHQLDTRSIYIMPTTNSLGYAQRRRGEALGGFSSIDPNRDFAIDQQESRCMQSITARAVNEVWREHLFQLAITFHAGIHMITYEWGSFSHFTGSRSTISPDDVAQVGIGQAMSAYAGAYDEGRYPTGRSNDILYPVNGGMEDWGYAASWEPNPCNPNTYGGYAPEKTQYTSAMTRAFNILVETSRRKGPFNRDYGTNADVWTPEGEGDGHVPRNIRLIFQVSDFVQPYAKMVAPGTFAPDACSSVRFPQDGTPAGEVPDRIRIFEGSSVAFAWEVGGANIVDETQLMWGPWEKRNAETLEECGPECGVSDVQSGYTRWAGGSVVGSGLGDDSVLTGQNVDLDAEYVSRGEHPFIPQFVACADIPNQPGPYFVKVRSRVDQAWATQPQTPDPAVAPQSHIVNARTNPNWDMRNNGHRVKGRLDYFSDPAMVIVNGPSPGRVSSTAYVGAAAAAGVTFAAVVFGMRRRSVKRNKIVKPSTRSSSGNVSVVSGNPVFDNEGAAAPLADTV